ncbi:stromal interaction molecule homolog isoform X2 [Aethina tumida]|uniref:stromal interaction molecule homolog isoform X2 n=1 Tax=Aethina tumida TaxID=116153 RepID=UPI0021497347|nr:stromal interaction molecule homolog isoform X2 [Aethina tumida]
MHIRALIFWLVFCVSGKCVQCEPDSVYQIASEAVKHNELSNAESKNSGSEAREPLRSTYSSSDLTTSNSHKDVLYETCSIQDFACLAMAASDKLGLEAIKSLHQKLDDDANGNIDLSESDDFLREELKYDSGYEKRQKVFHKNDMHISVKELWEAWLKSDVHNWTIQQTTEWLTQSVELPQYVPNFIQHKVTGANLPRLAANNAHYLSLIGIKDPIHKQKISLKAMDVVLFGPPKDSTPHWKDLTLIFLTIVGGLGVYYAFQQNKRFRHHLARMNRDMDSLQNAEKALENLQKELEVAKQAQESVITEKLDLEKKLQADSLTLSTSNSDLEVSQLKAEIEMLRTELQIAEGELKDRCWAPPPGLQQWLQLTHEIENKGYIKKKIIAEKQLQQAREACEKLRKKRSSLVGAFVSTHGKSIDEVDRSIVEARTALNEVTQELQERVHRWKQIELLCGFNIINNSGINSLENVLYNRVGMNGRGLKGRMNSTDDLDDETGSLYGGHAGYVDATHPMYQWKEGDSSESENSKMDEEVFVSDQKTVSFVVGGNVDATWPEDPIPQPVRMPHRPARMLTGPRSVSNNDIHVATPPKSGMIRAYSQDSNIVLETLGRAKAHATTSSSDPSLEGAARLPSRSSTRELQYGSIEEDVCSTDSSLMEDDVKKKKRKLFSFAKKNKTKGD